MKTDGKKGTKASDLLVQCLETEGVKYIFGLPGEENEDVLFSLEPSKITFIPTRHEQGAAFMANVWGRITGEAGVCLATLGPGATNLITGVADAHLDKSPIIALTGQADSHRMHKESHQMLDIVTMFKPIVKWNNSINHPNIIPEVVRKAFKLSQMEKPGATHIELPEDIAKEHITGKKPLTPEKVRRAAPDYKAVKNAIALLKKAKKPLIIAGNGAIRKKAASHLQEFVEHTKIPVVTTFMGKGAISDKHECSLLSVGLKARDYVMCAIDQADVIIAVGYDVAEYHPEAWNPQADKKIIHIDFTEAEVYDFYQPEVEVVCDISATLWELNKIVKKEKIQFDPSWIKPIRKEIQKDLASYDLTEGNKFTVPGALNIVREIMRDEDILISDVGAHKMWIARNYQTYKPNTCIISNGLASMGISLPGGIAAKLARPKQRVVSAMGDGGFMMNSHEIETAKRTGVGYTIVVFNDNDYGLIRWKQEDHHGRAVGTTLSNPDFKKYAESFGIKGYSPKTVKELKANLKEAITSEKLCLVEVKIDPSVNRAFSKKMAGNVCKVFEN